MRVFALLFLTVVLPGLYSCTSVQLDLPSVTSEASGTRSPGKVIWHDLVTEDPEAAKRFYGGLFGWQFKTVAGGNYSLILHGDRAIGGMVDGRKFEQEGNISQWVVVIAVEDIEQAVSTLNQSGGKVFGGPTDMGERGRMVLAADPQGAIVALLQTRDGDPPDRAAAVGEFMWNELWTSDVSRATAFYTDLLPYQAGTLKLEDGSSYHYLKSDDRPRAAVVENPVEGLAPTWVAYVRVQDTAAVAAKVEKLGGQLMLPSQRNPIGGELAIIKDPSGAGFIIQTWDKDQQELSP